MIAGMGRAGGHGGGDELEVEEDGSWKALLSGGGSRAGRFGGRLDDAALERLKGEVAAAAEAGPPTREEPWPPGGAVDTFWAGEVVGQFTQAEDPPGPWGPLAATCRSLLEGASEAPLAAVELDASGDGTLRHIGAEELTISDAGFSVEATLFGSDSALLGSWTTSVPAPPAGLVAPGWETAVGLSASGLKPAGGQTVAVSVSFALGAGLPRPLNLWAST